MQLVGGRDVTQQAVVERGGAFYIDLIHDLGRSGVLNLRVANRDLFGNLTNGAINLKLFSFERDNYPNLCPTGVTNIQLANGVALVPPIALAASCEFSTLMITNVAPLTGELMIQDVRAGYAAAVAPGDVFVSTNTGRVLVYRDDGSPVTAWGTGQTGEITGSVFDQDGNFYVTAFDTSTVKKLGPDGSLLGDFGTGYSTSPESIVLDSGGTFYVGHADGTKDIHRRDAQGSLAQIYDVAFEDRGSDWLALKPDGCTMLYTSEGTRVFQFDVCTGTQLADLTTLGSKGFEIDLLSDGSMLIASQSVVRRLSPSGALLQTYDAAGQSCWFGIEASLDETTFWAADTCSGLVHKFSIQTGQVLLSRDTGSRPSPGNDALGGVTIKPAGSGSVAPQEQPTVVAQAPDEAGTDSARA